MSLSSPDTVDLESRVGRFQEIEQAILGQVRSVIVGQEEVVEQVLISLFVGGHCLITGMPGTAKTLLVRALAAAVHDGWLGRLAVERTDGEHALASPAAAVLEQAGFVATPGGLRLRR